MFPVSWLYIRVYTYPLVFAGQTGNIWLTALIAASRYIAACWPYNAARYCSLPVIKKAVSGTLAFSVLYNLPRLFEVDMVLKQDANSFLVEYTSNLPSSPSKPRRLNIMSVYALEPNLLKLFYHLEY